MKLVKRLQNEFSKLHSSVSESEKKSNAKLLSLFERILKRFTSNNESKPKKGASAMMFYLIVLTVLLSFFVSCSFKSEETTEELVNILPVISALEKVKDIEVETNEDSSIVFNLMDKNDYSLKLKLISVPKFGIATDCFSGFGKVDCKYTPRANYFGEDKLIYSVTHLSSTVKKMVTVRFEVKPVNDAPTVEGGHYLVKNGVENPIVIAEFEDIDSDMLQLVIVSNPLNGVVKNCEKKEKTFHCVYIPNEDYAGIDKFIYQISDGKRESKLATATLLISSPDDSDGDLVPDYLEKRRDTDPLIANIPTLKLVPTGKTTTSVEYTINREVSRKVELSDDLKERGNSKSFYRNKLLGVAYAKLTESPDFKRLRRTKPSNDLSLVADWKDHQFYTYKNKSQYYESLHRHDKKNGQIKYFFNIKGEGLKHIQKISDVYIATYLPEDDRRKVSKLSTDLLMKDKLSPMSFFLKEGESKKLAKIKTRKLSNVSPGLIISFTNNRKKLWANIDDFTITTTTEKKYKASHLLESVKKKCARFIISTPKGTKTYYIKAGEILTDSLQRIFKEVEITRSTIHKLGEFEKTLFLPAYWKDLSTKERDSTIWQYWNDGLMGNRNEFSLQDKTMPETTYSFVFGTALEFASSVKKEVIHTTKTQIGGLDRSSDKETIKTLHGWVRVGDIIEFNLLNISENVPGIEKYTKPVNQWNLGTYCAQTQQRCVQKQNKCVQYQAYREPGGRGGNRGRHKSLGGFEKSRTTCAQWQVVCVRHAPHCVRHAPKRVSQRKCWVVYRKYKETRNAVELGKGISKYLERLKIVDDDGLFLSISDYLANGVEPIQIKDENGKLEKLVILIKINKELYDQIRDDGLKLAIEKDTPQPVEIGYSNHQCKLSYKDSFSTSVSNAFYKNEPYFNLVWKMSGTLR